MNTILRWVLFSLLFWTWMRRRVAYMYDSSFGEFNYGDNHPMRPLRIRMAHELIVETQIFRWLRSFKPWLATCDDMKKFHSNEYIDFMMNSAPGSKNEGFNIGDI